MTSPFQQALLALEIAVDALHGLSKESRDARLTAEDAFAQIAHLGFDTRPSDDRVPKSDPKKPPESHVAKESTRKREKSRKRSQKSLFD